MTTDEMRERVSIIRDDEPAFNMEVAFSHFRADLWLIAAELIDAMREGRHGTTR